VQVTGDTGMSTCMITHDLGVVAEMCDDVVVMRGGETCEAGSCAQVMTKPRHDYTKQLLAASRAEVSVS
jgi:ABC-type dipeptide/oligopeptide/nickel transport system ATPase component